MEVSLAAVLGAVLLVLLLASVVRPRGYPPGPSWLPLVGCYLPFKASLARLGYHHLVWADFARHFGPVTGLKLGKDRIVVISGYEAVKHVLLRDDCDGRPDGFIYRVRTYGQKLGVLITDGYLWKQQRRFSGLHLKNLGLKGDTMEKLILEEADALVESIRELCKETQSAEVSLHTVCAVSVINNLWAVVAGKRYDLKDERLVRLFRLLSKYFSVVDMTGGVLNQMPLLRFIAPQRTGYNIIMEAVSALQEFMAESVEEHKMTLQVNEEPRDFMDAYLQEIEKKKDHPDSNFTEQQLLSILLDFFMAGAETTNNTLGFSLLYLLHHPEVQRRAQRDIDAVVGRARPPSLADKQNLPYVEALIMEVQRVTTVVPVTVAHCPLHDVEIFGHSVPKGTMLIPNLWSVMMDPEYWGDPEVFRPERFLDSTGKTLTKEERVIPFGIGKHRCLGESLARSSLFLFLTSLLQNFTFEMVPGEAPPSLLPQDGITLSPQPFTGIVKLR